MTTLVLLPGMDGTGALFKPFVRELPSSIHAKVVAYPANQRLDYAELTRLATSSLPEKGDFFLLGESFSGPIAIALAEKAGARLRGLILVCSFASTPRPALAWLRHLVRLLPSPRITLAPLSFALMGRHATPALREALEAALSRVELSVLRHRASTALSIDASASLAQVMCPVMYLQAEEDRVVPSACASNVQHWCKHAQVVRLAGPHFLLQTQPAQASFAVETFIRRSENAA